MELGYDLENFDENILEEIDREKIDRNHLTAELLAKKGYNIKKPLWNGLIAS